MAGYLRKRCLMDAEQFYKLAAEPEFDDSMVFRLENTNPDNPYTFSHDGVENIVDHIHDFIIARTMGTWAKTGSPPKKVSIGVTLLFDKSDDGMSPALPWWEGKDSQNEGLSLLDGEHRIPRKHLDR